MPLRVSSIAALSLSFPDAQDDMETARETAPTVTVFFSRPFSDVQEDKETAVEVRMEVGVNVCERVGVGVRVGVRVREKFPLLLLRVDASAKGSLLASPLNAV